MHLLPWFDNRTLIACQCLLAVVFTIAFFGMKWLYPGLRGVRSVALSFLLGIPGSILIASRGHISFFVSVMVANTFVFGSFLFLYRGILRFAGSRRPIYLPVGAVVASLAILYYYSQVDQNIVPRLIAISLTIGLIRGLIAVELFRKAYSATSPAIMRLFGASMSFFATVSLDRGLMTFLHGAPANYLENNLIQTTTLMLGVVSICLTGLFFLVLSSGDLITNSRNESEQDTLSGAFNRRGIESRLAVELSRADRSSQKLSIALIDIDHFKSINDTHGHAVGDSAIRDVAETISGRLRAYDSLGRFGGDEFLLLLPQTPCSDALIVTDRLSRAVNLLTIADTSRTISLSIGLTEAVPGDNAFTLLARADKALYQAKSDGRNCRRLVLSGADSVIESRAHTSRLFPAAKPGLL